MVALDQLQRLNAVFFEGPKGGWCGEQPAEVKSGVR
jgi:hypothetical protein